METKVASDTEDGPGAPSSPSGGEVPQPGDRLSRSADHRMIAGVAAGLAEYFDVDPTIVRIGFVVLALVGGLALPLYAAGWLLIPEAGTDLSVAEELLARERAR